MKLGLYVAKGVVKVKDLEIGSLFLHENTVAFKTGAYSDDGTPFCAVVGERRTFTGGTNTADELNNLYVNRVSLRKN